MLSILRRRDISSAYTVLVYQRHGATTRCMASSKYHIVSIMPRDFDFVDHLISSFFLPHIPPMGKRRLLLSLCSGYQPVALPWTTSQLYGYTHQHFSSAVLTSGDGPSRGFESLFPHIVCKVLALFPRDVGAHALRFVPKKRSNWVQFPHALDMKMDMKMDMKTDMDRAAEQTKRDRACMSGHGTCGTTGRGTQWVGT